MDNPPGTPTSHPLPFSSPPTLRVYQSPGLRLLSNRTFRCPFLSDHTFFPLTHTAFLYNRALTSWAHFLYDIPSSRCSLVAPA